jgi:hypothetical protein
MLRLSKAFNDKCAICDYSKCPSALEYHHLNPDEKEFSISSFKVAKWEKIVDEARKVDWDNIDLAQLLLDNNYTQTGKLLNITATSVRKRAIKLGLI